jgi:hypothetical protein
VGGTLATAGKAALTVGAGVVAGVGCEVVTGPETGGLSTAGCVVAGFTAAGAVSGALNCSGSEWKCVGEGAAAGAAGGVAFVATGGVGAGIIGTALAGGAAGAASTATGQALATGHVNVRDVVAGAVVGAASAGIVRGAAGKLAGGEPSATKAAPAVVSGEAASAPLYHYTSADPASVFENGLLPGTSGNVYLTPQGDLSPIQAHIDLGLAPGRGFPQHLFEVDAQGAADYLGIDLPAATRVAGWPGGGAGGGWEVPVPGAIPPWLLRLVR